MPESREEQAANAAPDAIKKNTRFMTPSVAQIGTTLAETCFAHTPSSTVPDRHYGWQWWTRTNVPNAGIAP
jgi:hypothetical protein